MADFLLPQTLNRADPNLRNEYGETALHRASSRGRLEVVKHLIDNDHANERSGDSSWGTNCINVMNYLQTLTQS